MPDDKSLGFVKSKKNYLIRSRLLTCFKGHQRCFLGATKRQTYPIGSVYAEGVGRLRYCDKQLMEWETTNSTLVSQSRPKN